MLEADWGALGRCRAVSGAADSVYVLNTEGVCRDRNLLKTDPGRPCWAVQRPRRIAGGSARMLEADWGALGRCRAVSGAADSVYVPSVSSVICRI